MVQKGHLARLPPAHSVSVSRYPVCLGGSAQWTAVSRGQLCALMQGTCVGCSACCGAESQGEALGGGWYVLLEQSRKTSVRKRYLSRSLKPGKSCWRSVLVSGDRECQGCGLGQGLQCLGSERGQGDQGEMGWVHL